MKVFFKGFHFLLSSVALKGNGILLPLRYKTSHGAIEASNSPVYGNFQKPSYDGLFKHSSEWHQHPGSQGFGVPVTCHSPFLRDSG